MRESILIVDTPASLRNLEKESLLQQRHFQTFRLDKPEKAVEWLRQNKKPTPDLLLMDIDCGEVAICNALLEIKSMNLSLPSVVMVNYGDDGKGVKVVACGAADYLTKPTTSERLYQTLQTALRMQRMGQYVSWLERRVAGHVDTKDMVGESPALIQAVELGRELASLPDTVYISGENGTGKSLLARMIHGCGPRANNPFIEVNCELMPQGMAAENLFGRDTLEGYIVGKIREADQGTLMLQKPHLLSADVRQRLMQMCRSGVIVPYGAHNPMPVDVRIICADNVGMGLTSIFYRELSAIGAKTINMPSLRDRKSDIPALARYFLVVHATSENRYVTRISNAAIEWLCGNLWPGNIAQLRNIIWRAVMLCERNELDVADLQAVYRQRPLYLATQEQTADIVSSTFIDDQGQVRTLRSVEQEAIRFAITQSGGCMSRAARSLGIGRSTLYRKVQEFSLGDYISRANQTTRPMITVSAVDRS